ncbi:MAG: PspA/IM30 family protein [Actinomycetaceae bacterium]|nr:PspA/IM30 family protein [Actinomycetaceae bacterium]
MAEKQTIFGRIAQLAKANINAIIDRAEDPQKMLDQLIRDYTNSIIEAEHAVAQTVGNLRLAEKEHAEDVSVAADWGRKAAAASAKAEEMRAAGDTAGADKWDGLARVAIGKQIQYEGEAKEAEPMIASQTEVVSKLTAGLAQMKTKLEELKSKRDQLVARQKSAEAQAKVTDAISSINVLDPTSELSRFEDRVRRQEALAQGKAEIAASSLESQFAELETDASQFEVEARLAALKQKS